MISSCGKPGLLENSDCGIKRASADIDADHHIFDIFGGGEVYQRIKRLPAGELHLTFCQLEGVSRKTKRAAHQIYLTRHTRLRAGAANTEVGRPFAFQTHAGHIQLLRRDKVDVEPHETEQASRRQGGLIT